MQHNVERTRRADSFGVKHCGYTCRFLVRGKAVEIQLSCIPCGFGGEQVFFLCPRCGTRCRYLYDAEQAPLCRRCARLNYSCQQDTRDSFWYYLEGMRYAKKHLLVNPEYLPDTFSFARYVPDRPKGMHTSTYQRHLKRFQQYQRKQESHMWEEFSQVLNCCS